MNNVTNENPQDLTEQWLQKQLPEDEYYVELNDGTYDYLIYTKDDEPEIDREIMEIKRVIAPVPSYEKWKALNGNMDSVMQTNQALCKKLAQLKEMLKECSPYVSRSATSRMIKNSVGFKKDMKLLTKINEVLECGNDL